MMSEPQPKAARSDPHLSRRLNRAPSEVLIFQDVGFLPVDLCNFSKEQRSINTLLR